MPKPNDIKRGDAVEPVPGRRFATVEKYKWVTGLVQAVVPGTISDDMACECEVITIVGGKEVRFWEFSDNIKLKEEKKY